MGDQVEKNSKLRVLVVDDDSHIREFLAKVLSKDGFQVSTASMPEEALESARNNSTQIAIVDINLGEVIGLDLCRQLADEFHIEVLLITGAEDRYSYATAAEFGAVDFFLKPIRLNELRARIERALTNRRLREERDALVDELRRLSMTDALTGLFNARHFFAQLTLEIGRTSRYGTSFSLLILDVDHFKIVNDRFGHQRGDEVLRRIAEGIEDSIRDVDTAYRYGGEEMAVILPETGEESVGIVADRLLKNTCFEIVGEKGSPALQISTSIGVANWGKGETPKMLIKRADLAMYAAKKNGRNRVHVAPRSSEGLAPNVDDEKSGEVEVGHSPS